MDNTRYHQRMLQRAQVAVIVILCAFAGLVIRLFWIQIVRQAKYEKEAFRQHWSKEALPARRGEIRDRNGVILAISLPAHSCYADPAKIKNPTYTARLLSPLLEVPERDLVAQLSQSDRRFVWLKRLLSDEKTEEVRSLNLPGIYFKKEPRRYYPHGKLAAHVLGFVGVDHRGLEGVEASFSTELSGEDGYTWILKDGRLSRTGLCPPEAPGQPPVHGATVYLTIDIVLQRILEEELDFIADKFDPLGASGVLLEVKSGEVLAMASRPHYDPNCFNQYEPRTWRNLAIADAYESGSVLKPFIIAAALAEGVYPEAENKIIDCHNGLYRTKFGRRLTDCSGYGDLTLEGIVIHSSNIGAAIVGQDLGKEKMHHYLTHLYFGKRIGISLPGEASGNLKPLPQWNKYTLTSVPMGYEICTSVLQLAAAYSVLAGDGIYWPPSIVNKIVYADGTIAYRYHPEKVLRIYPPQVVTTMQRILRGVVKEGTAKNANVDLVAVAGKTGTAKKYDKEIRQYSKKYLSVFAGFAPAERPEFCCVIMVDEAKGAYAGGTVAAPSVVRVLQQSSLHTRLAGTPIHRSVMQN